MFSEYDIKDLKNIYKSDSFKIPDEVLNFFLNESMKVLEMSNGLVVELGFDSVHTMIELIGMYSLHNGFILPIGNLISHGERHNVVLSDLTGDLKVYYVVKTSQVTFKLYLLSNSFKDLLHYELTDNGLLSDLITNTKLAIVEAKGEGFDYDDLQAIKYYLHYNKLPLDLVLLFNNASRFEISFKDVIDDWSPQLSIGESSAYQMVLNFNNQSLFMEHHALVIGIDGFSHSILYSDKDGDFKLYFVADDNFEESEFIYLADTLFELIVNGKGLDVLFNFE